MKSLFGVAVKREPCCCVPFVLGADEVPFNLSPAFVHCQHFVQRQ